MSSVKKFNDLNTANTLCVRRAPYNSGFARKTRAKPSNFRWVCTVTKKQYFASRQYKNGIEEPGKATF
jgi:hypothetical protein